MQAAPYDEDEGECPIVCSLALYFIVTLMKSLWSLAWYLVGSLFNFLWYLGVMVFSEPDKKPAKAKTNRGLKTAREAPKTVSRPSARPPKTARKEEFQTLLEAPKAACKETETAFGPLRPGRPPVPTLSAKQVGLLAFPEQGSRDHDRHSAQPCNLWPPDERHHSGSPRVGPRPARGFPSFSEQGPRNDYQHHNSGRRDGSLPSRGFPSFPEQGPRDDYRDDYRYDYYREQGPRHDHRDDYRYDYYREQGPRHDHRDDYRDWARRPFTPIDPRVPIDTRNTTRGTPLELTNTGKNRDAQPQGGLNAALGSAFRNSRHGKGAYF